MHELGIMTGVIEAAEKAARDSGATRLLKVNLSIGEMTEAIEDALVFAWEALTEDCLLYTSLQARSTSTRASVASSPRSQAASTSRPSAAYATNASRSRRKTSG